jgi:D-amino-acid dehydrogenase
MSLHVVVIGAGIVGAAASLELLAAGARVTILEPGEPGGPQSASYGNGAWISPASVVPMSMPGLWKRVPGFLLDRAGPLTISPLALPYLMPWLIRFLRAGSSIAKVEATARALRVLLADAPARHMALAQSVGVGGLIEQRGLLYAYPDRAAFEAETLAWRLRRDNGVGWTELDGAQLHDFEPDLSPHYGFGVHVAAGAHCIDPGAYVAALVSEAKRRGAKLLSATAAAFKLEGRRLVGVVSHGEVIACDRALIAAGVHGAMLARSAGDKVPIASERGYHVVVSSPEAGPRIPIMPSDGKMANTMTTRGLRAAGQVELAGIDDAPDWRRAEILLKYLQTAYPGLPRMLPESRLSRWMGHRPSTPDGLPVIGLASGCRDIGYAFGHGHVGLAAGPISGQLAADLLLGRTPSVDLGPYAATRF